MKKKLVVLTGAGISAESGIQTFRDSDGLWEGFDVRDVATPEAWQRNPALVQEFYNQRRAQVLNAEPNAAHVLLKQLEHYFDVQIITQNIDDLHERAGSSNITHLHGLITYAQSDSNANLLCPIDGPILKMGAFCALGSQLRPHVVWFGESVPMIEKAINICKTADLFMVIGTSLAVYPAANLIYDVPLEVTKYIIDPKIPTVRNIGPIIKVEEKAIAGLTSVYNELLTYA